MEILTYQITEKLVAIKAIEQIDLTNWQQFQDFDNSFLAKEFQIDLQEDGQGGYVDVVVKPNYSDNRIFSIGLEFTSIEVQKVTIYNEDGEEVKNVITELELEFALDKHYKLY